MPGTGYIFIETESPLLNFIECDNLFESMLVQNGVRFACWFQMGF